MTAGRRIHSLSHHWCTPPHYVEAVERVLGQVSLDPCSNPHSIVRADVKYSLPEKDGLKESWDFPTIYVNPPYGRDPKRGTSISDWLKRCAEISERGAEVIALIPCAPNTQHWKLYVWPAASAVAFLYDTRLKFLVEGVPGGKGAPMACVMVHWGRKTGQFLEVFSEFGAAIELSCLRRPVSPKVTLGQRRGREES